MLQWNETFRLKRKVLHMWELAQFLKGYMIPVKLWRKRKVGPSMCSFWKLQTNREAEWEAAERPHGRWNSDNTQAAPSPEWLQNTFASLRLVHWSLNRGNPPAAFVFMKGLSIRKTEVAYPRLMYYTAAFVLKQLSHSEGCFVLSVESWILQWLDSFSGITQCLLYLLMAGFAWQHVLVGRLGKLRNTGFSFFKMSNFVDAKQFFWTSEFCLDCYAHLLSNLEVIRLFQLHICE